jgi:hypothetical protein
MISTNAFRLERHAMCLLLACLFLFSFWTIAHQFSTFLEVSWSDLLRVSTWALAPIAVLSIFMSRSLATTYVGQLTTPDNTAQNAPSSTAWWLGMAALGALLFVQSYTLRYVVLAVALAAIWMMGRVSAYSPTAPSNKPAAAPLRGAHNSIALLLLTAAVVLIVLCANRSDFDDAEYIQSAIQTIRHPDKGVFTFDASLGTVLDRFRFAPYRLTSYETFVGLLATLTGMDILDVYYLLVPGAAAALSVLTAFIFLRWFLPLRWTIVAVVLFIAVALAWGESHVAFGNRMYVRLFQGKGLLIAITSPMAILMAMLWMRRPTSSTWLGLLAVQVAAVGVSSSGLVVTLFATAIGLLSGFLAQPSRRALLHTVVGGLTLAYPIGLGLWLKYLSSASGKVEEIGTYLPINASFGSSLREVIAMLILCLTCAALLRKRPSVQGAPESTASGSDRTAFWLVACSFLLVLNPFLIPFVTQATSQNMNWRLAWAAPIPLLLALGMTVLWRSSLGAPRRFGLSLLGPAALCAAFFVAGAWTLAPGNKVTWSWASHKVPPEFHQARDLASEIRRLAPLGERPVVLVDPRIGTWLTVVAPEFKLVMPGHGYIVTLQTILEPGDFERRTRLLNNLGAIAEGDPSFDALLDLYHVNVVVTPGAEQGSFRLHYRELLPADGRSADPPAETSSVTMKNPIYSHKGTIDEE